LLPLLAVAPGARGESTATFEITGSFAPAAQGIAVVVQVRSRAASPVASIRIEGEWCGQRAWAFLAGPFSPGGFGEARLRFTRPPPPGTHALILLFDFVRSAGPETTWGHEATALLLAIDALPTPAVRLSVAPVVLREAGEAVLHLESADGRPHRVRLAVRLPHVLACDPRARTVDVPMRGGVDARVRVFRARAEPDRYELIAAATTEGDPVARTALAKGVVDVAADTPWVPRARPALLLGAISAALWAGYRQRRNRA
jgi:hypothetical protein